ILKRARKTRSQTRLSINARRENLRGAFRCSAGDLTEGASILLVDDIITTGTTVTEASAELAKAGAADIAVAGLGYARI
ncbi:MAG: ComF family protein, partial [Rhodothermales bacterium]|nr:ComF family protein [Rhodothermales bacterium]